MENITGNTPSKITSERFLNLYRTECGYLIASRKKEKPDPNKVDAVAVVINDEKETHLILVRQFRPAIQKYEIDLVAGLVDEGETPEQAGIRETLEETGLNITLAQGMNLPPFYSSAGLTDENYKLIAGTYNPEIELIKPESGIEVIKYYPKHGIDSIIKDNDAISMRALFIITGFTLI